MILAQGAIPASIVSWIIIAMVIAGIVGIAIIVAHAAGITIPQWVIQILWIVLAVVIGVVAIKFLVGLL